MKVILFLGVIFFMVCWVLYLLYELIGREIMVRIWCKIHGWRYEEECMSWGWDMGVRYFGIDKMGERHYWFGDNKFRITI